MRCTVITIASSILFCSAVHSSPLHSFTRRAPASIAGYSYEGCRTEASQGRALSSSAYYDDLMTVQKCAVACSQFTYFGVEYGRECFCGNSFNDGSEPTDEVDCSFTCPGNSAQNCGAGNRLNVYKKTPSATTSVAGTSPTSATFTDKGCYTEPSSGRALTGHVYYDDAMTTEKCASACSGFKYFGIEYHRECYCGNSLTDGAEPAPAADCKFTCDADPTQQCGGDWRLNLYTFGASSPAPATPAGYTSEGCHTDNTANRALTGAVLFDDAMTVENCSVVCEGWALFGVEYGRECFCGNTLEGGSAPAPSPECSFPCAGDDAERCGAGDRLNVYRYGSTVVSSSSTSSSSTTISSSSTTSSTTSTTTTTTESPTTTALITSSTESTTASSTTTTTTLATSSTPSPTTTSSTTTSSPSPTTTSSTTTSSPSLTTTSSTTTTTSSTTTTTTTTTTASPTPTPVNFLPNGDFEATSDIGWRPSNSNPCSTCATHDFMSPGDPSIGASPHGGKQVAQVNFKPNASGVGGNFERTMDTEPNTSYRFSAWSFIPTYGTGCQVRYYFQPVYTDSTNPFQAVDARNTGTTRGTWYQTTTTFTSGSGGVRRVIAQINCSAVSAIARTIYVDDITFNKV